MIPSDFVQFRDLLKPASGFQSSQFREIEFASGLKDRRYLGMFRNDSQATARLEARLAQPTIWDRFIALLKRGGYQVDDEAAQTQAIIQIYRRGGDHALRSLCEAMIEYDEMFSLWREHHVRMAKLDTLEQFLVLCGAAAEQIDVFCAAAVDLVLLRGGADQNRVGWKRAFAGGVLRMKVSGGEVQHGTFGQLLRLAQHDRTVARPHAGIDDQRRAGSDYIGDVGETDNRVNVLYFGRDPCLDPFQEVHPIGNRTPVMGAVKAAPVAGWKAPKM